MPTSMLILALSALFVHIHAQSPLISLNSALDSTIFKAFPFFQVSRFDLKSWLVDNLADFRLWTLMDELTNWDTVPTHSIPEAPYVLYFPDATTSISDVNAVPSFIVWLTVAACLAVLAACTMVFLSCTVHTLTLTKATRPRLKTPVRAAFWAYQCMASMTVGSFLFVVAGAVLWFTASTEQALVGNPLLFLSESRDSLLANVEGITDIARALPEVADAVRHIHLTDALEVLEPQFLAVDQIAANFSAIMLAAVDINTTITDLEAGVDDLNVLVNTFTAAVTAISSDYSSSIGVPSVGTNLHDPIDTIYHTLDSIDLATARANASAMINDAAKIPEFEAASVLLSLGLGTALNKTTAMLDSLAWLGSKTPESALTTAPGIPPALSSVIAQSIDSPGSITGPGMAVSVLVTAALLLAAWCCVSGLLSGGQCGLVSCSWCMGCQSCCSFALTSVLLAGLAILTPVLKLSSLACTDGKMWTADLLSRVAGLDIVSDTLTTLSGYDVVISIDTTQFLDIISCQGASITTIFGPSYASTNGLEGLVEDFVGASSFTVPTLSGSVTFADYFAGINTTAFLDSLGLEDTIVSQVNKSLDSISGQIHSMQTQATSQSNIDLSSSGLDISTLQSDIATYQTDVADDSTFGWDQSAAVTALSNYHSLIAQYYTDNCGAADFCTACGVEKGLYDSDPAAFTTETIEDWNYVQALIACIVASVAPPDTSNLETGLASLDDLKQVIELITQFQVDTPPVLSDIQTALATLDTQLGDVNAVLRPDMLGSLSDFNTSLDSVNVTGISSVITGNAATALGVITTNLAQAAEAADRATDCSIIGGATGLVGEGLCGTSRGWLHVLYILLLILALVGMAHCVSTYAVYRFIARSPKKARKKAAGKAEASTNAPSWNRAGSRIIDFDEDSIPDVTNITANPAMANLVTALRVTEAVAKLRVRAGKLTDTTGAVHDPVEYVVPLNL
ncbi:hypothetical protein J8273_3050 [Carpediemonas membranifera]|uniref:Uncharacterized protein n=1 Tax=Carpediemonas membranifera TaxID=201153 RepID=A0A8J6AV15_9EUKA|nr:hypothetical protein J8273_3050 [Carpediemonas membranifera]|eukprot:KAG9395476.1 hypothetical protein J8273_3050 [Carpediemonas membranifera]